MGENLNTKGIYFILVICMHYLNEVNEFLTSLNILFKTPLCQFRNYCISCSGLQCSKENALETSHSNSECCPPPDTFSELFAGDFYAQSKAVDCMEGIASVLPNWPQGSVSQAQSTLSSSVRHVGGWQSRETLMCYQQ